MNPLPLNLPADDSGNDPLGPADRAALWDKFSQLKGTRTARQQDRERAQAKLQALAQYLDLAPQIDAALDKLSEELFGKLAQTIQTHLSIALQEVLNQPITLKIQRDTKRGVANMRFYIERQGNEEDIMRGQGGSVANILSVGLRIFALTQLDPQRHRKFLVLDEQDCWLAPELVPRLVKIVSQVARALDFQVLMISHHAAGSFEPYADKILRLIPGPDSIEVEDITPASTHPD